MFNKLILAASVIALPSTAAAAGAGITYDCDTAAGHYSELVLPAPAGSFSVSGNVKVNTIYKDKNWAPTARVRIGSAPTAPGSTPSAYGGLKLTALPGKSVSLPAETVQAFSFDGSGQESAVIPSSLQASGATQPFRMSFDGRSVVVAIAGQTQTYPLATAEPVVQVVCSTGEFLFTDLKLETSN